MQLKLKLIAMVLSLLLVSSSLLDPVPCKARWHRLVPQICFLSSYDGCRLLTPRFRQKPRFRNFSSFFVECGAEKIFAAIKVENWVNCCNLSCSCSASIPGSVFFFFSGVGDDDDDDDDDCDGVANVWPHHVLADEVVKNRQKNPRGRHVADFFAAIMFSNLLSCCWRLLFYFVPPRTFIAFGFFSA